MGIFVFRGKIDVMSPFLQTLPKHFLMEVIWVKEHIKEWRRNLGPLCNWVHFDLLSPETIQIMLEILGWFSSLHFS